MTVKLNISTKQREKEVNYIPFNTNSRAFTISDVKEVRKENVSKLTKLGILSSTLSLSMIPNMVFAEAIPTEPTHVPELLINPQLVFDWAMRIALVGLGVSTGTAMVFLIGSGIVKQLGGEKRRKKAKEWNTDIIKGFIQCLVAIPVVFALYYLGTTIFGQLSFSKDTLINLP